MTYVDVYGDTYSGSDPRPPDTGTSFGQLFGHPFSERGDPTSAANPSVPGLYDCSIGGRGYVVDWKYSSWGLVDPLRDARDFGARPGEQSLSTRSSWKRNQTDWRYGAGQLHGDDEGSNQAQFYASKGIDPWSQRRFCLLHDTELLIESEASGLGVFVAGDYLYLVDDETVRFSDDLETWTDVDLGNTILAWTTDHDAVYFSVATDGCYSGAVGSATITAMADDAATYQPTVLAYANGWLLGALGNAVSQIGADGSLTAVYEHTVSGFEFTVIAGAPNAIYLGGNLGETGELRSVGVADDGALDVPVWAGELPAGEALHAAAYYGSRLALGTSRGLRIATLGSGFGTSDAVSIGPVILTDHPVGALHGQAESVWFAWTDYDATSTGLGRARLDRFTADETPAYASDLMATGEGVVTAIATFLDKRAFTVDGLGLYIESDDLVPSGTMDSGWLTFSLFEPKALSSIESIFDPLAGEITMSLVRSDGSVTAIGRYDVPGTDGRGQRFTMAGEAVEEFRIQVTLARSEDDSTEGPCVHRISVRAIPLPTQVDEWTLALIIRDQVSVTRGTGNADILMDPAVEWSWLRELNRAGRPVLVQVGKQRFIATVRTVTQPQDAIRGLNDALAIPQGLTMVTLLTTD